MNAVQQKYGEFGQSAKALSGHSVRNNSKHHETHKNRTAIFVNALPFAGTLAIIESENCENRRLCRKGGLLNGDHGGYCQKVGVSKGTVSKAINGAPDISETLRKTILETAVELGYLRARRGAARTLAILVENMGYTKPEDFGTDIVTGFRQMAEPAGYNVQVTELSVDLERTTRYDEYMLQQGYLGALLLGLSLEDPWLEDSASATPRGALRQPGAAQSHGGHPGHGQHEAVGQAVAALRAMGHRKVGYLSSALGSHIYRVRYQSFFNALRQNDLPDDPSLAGTSFFSSETLDAHLPRLLEQGVTAILCSSDLLAHTVMIRCQELGLHIPQDISIMGFDDLAFCAHTSPPLSTIRQDRLQLGKSGYYALQSLLDGVPISSLLLHAPLILRGSTGPAPQRQDQ